MIKDEMINYYKSIIDEETELSRKVGWRDELAQNRRFEQFIHLLKNEQNFEVADLGCGLSGFYNFLSKIFTDFKYIGYDLSSDMINKAKELNDFDNCSLKLISETEDIDKHDFIISSGIFNMKKDIDNTTWKNYIVEQLELINKKAEKGFAFNLLTLYSDKEFMRDELYYADPCFFFDYCKRNFSRNVALLHDYDEYDFTIIVRK